MRSLRPDLPWLAVVLAVALLHVAFAVLDTRVPGDHVLMFHALPAIQQGEPTSLARILLEPSGWYDLLVLGGLQLLGPSPTLLRVPGMVASVALVAGAALCARPLGGPRAALGAAALTGAVPMAIAWGRIVWFHVPEAALVVALVAVALHDPRLDRVASRIALAVLGALALTLRHTGLVWVATTLPLLIGVPWRRVAAVAVPWAVAALVPLASIGPYVFGKLQVRERYAEVVPPIWDQVPATLTWVSLIVALVGCAGLVRTRLPWRPAVVFGSWVAVPVLLVLVFRSGLDNHTLLAPGLGVLAALGLGRAAPALAALFVAHHALTPLRGPLAGILTPADQLELIDPARPTSALGAPQLRPLIAACPGCRIGVDRGLFHPYAVGGAELELYLLDLDARAVPIALRRRIPPLDAMSRYDCPGSVQARDFARLHPTATQLADAVAERDGLVLRYTTTAGGCTFEWWTR